jgi:hypothetical protein
MVALELNDCHSPRLSTETVDATPLAVHGGLLQRFVRREILSARDGLLRTNPYWRTFEASRWIVESIRRRNRQQQTPDPELASRSQGAAVAMRQ